MSCILEFKSCHLDNVMPVFPDLRFGSYGANVVFDVFLGYYPEFVLCVIWYADLYYGLLENTTFIVILMLDQLSHDACLAF